ncbi:M23 family metallopeptidase [Paeniglutamicibacter sp. MACA_103]|uniref:M23 family metallopeptidase n=1 Tax=Paeniglutamicibacter sp. MACA_103 TaxID=3377337 RepID=UPI003892D906
MKKHHVNHPLPLPKPRKVRRQPEAAKAAAVGLAVVAALAVSSTPTLAGRQIDSVPAAFSPLAVDMASYSRPVEVSLLSGIDAIAWDMENITSAAAGVQVADASDPGSALGSIGTPGLFAGNLVGQSAGPLGVLPGGIQLIHPVASRHITSPYGWRNNPTGPGTQIHIGQDYAVPCGSPVFASADGTVVQSAWAGHSGMRVTIDHGSSVRTGYSHNSRLIAKVGDTVKQGQLVALSGTTGNSTGCHVHFEVIINGRWNDPRNFLPVIPGQPNPKIDSRRTTIAAEPIRNTGDPRNESENGHDIEVEVPGPTKAPPTATAPGSETPRPKASEEAKPEETPSPQPTQTPTPKPSATPTPATPSPTTTPAPETNPTPEPSEATTPPTSPSPTTETPTVSPSAEPTESPTSASSSSPSSEPTESEYTSASVSSTSASTVSPSKLPELRSATPATESPSGAPTTGDGIAATPSSPATTAESS